MKTYAEQARIAYATGAPSFPLLEQAADLESASELAENVRIYTEEAKAQFPDEDCLEVFLTDLRHIAKCIRGPNREALQAVIEGIEEAQSSIANATGEGLECLNKAQAELENIPVGQSTFWAA